MILIGTFVMNQIMSGGYRFMLEMIRSLQLILHLPMLRIVFPANVSSLFSAIVPIAMLDVLDSEYTTELVFEFDDEG